MRVIDVTLISYGRRLIYAYNQVRDARDLENTR